MFRMGMIPTRSRGMQSCPSQDLYLPPGYHQVLYDLFFFLDLYWSAWFIYIMYCLAGQPASQPLVLYLARELAVIIIIMAVHVLSMLAWIASQPHSRPINQPGNNKVMWSILHLWPLGSQGYLDLWPCLPFGVIQIIQWPVRDVIWLSFQGTIWLQYK